MCGAIVSATILIQPIAALYRLQMLILIGNGTICPFPVCLIGVVGSIRAWFLDQTRKVYSHLEVFNVFIDPILKQLSMQVLSMDL